MSCTLRIALFLFLGGAAAARGGDDTKKTPAATTKSVPHIVARVTLPDARGAVEPSVAIDPTNTNHVIAASIQSGGVGTTNYGYVSTDGGKTWRTVPKINPQRRVQGDDIVAFGPDGVAHHIYIAFEGIRAPRPQRASSGIHVSSSKDGLTWSPPTFIVDHFNCVTPHEDKPGVRLDCVADSPHRGNFYVAWTRFDEYGSKKPEDKSHVFFSRSRDGGRTFSVPLRISDTPGDCLDDDNTVMGSTVGVGPGGEVYVVYAGPKGLVFKKSTNAGYTFSADKVITPTPGGWNLPVKNMGRHNGLPALGVDVSKGPHRGALYVNWIDERNGDLDVFVASSTDGGAAWSAPVRVNNDELKNGRQQLFTWMAVDPADGAVNVAFYDRREGDGEQTGLVLARSLDGGKTFVNYRVNQEPFKFVPNAFVGDYIGLDAIGGRVAAVFPHFLPNRQAALSSFRFDFKPGTQEVLDEKPVSDGTAR